MQNVRKIKIHDFKIAIFRSIFWFVKLNNMHTFARNYLPKIFNEFQQKLIKLAKNV